MTRYKYILVISFIIFGVALSTPGLAHASGYTANGVVGHTTYLNSYANDAPNDLGFNGASAVAEDTVHHRLFVSDGGNNRILVFNLDSNNQIVDREADYVLGHDDFNTGGIESISASSFYGPQGLEYDETNNRLFVADFFNSRVLIFDVSTITNGMNASYVLGQADFTSAVQGVTGQNVLYHTSDVKYDGSNERLFVSAYNRIMVFDVTPGTIANGENASYVLGQPDFDTSVSTTTQSGVNGPVGLAYDSSNTRLFVSDRSNYRVLTFNVATSTIANGENATHVLGQADFTSNVYETTQSGMNTPEGVAYDASNNYLYVSDSNNNRVLVFDVSSITDGENAINVLGQSDFVTGTATTTQSGMTYPGLIYYESGNHLLYVTGNNRILVFDVSSITNGENAVDALGQLQIDKQTPIYTTSGANNTPSNDGFNHPDYSALDADGHRMFVSDEYNNRVLVFNLNNNNTFPDYVADYVLGQPDFKSNTGGVTASLMNTPKGVEYDAQNDRLFVADSINSRVLIFDVSTITNGMDASYALGPSDLVSSGYYSRGTTAANLDYPVGVTYDAGNERLFVVDATDNRVLVFDVDPSTITTGEDALYALGQNDLVSNDDAKRLDGGSGLYITTRDGLSSPIGSAYDSANNYLYVSDSGDNRVVVYDVSTSTIATGEDALYVLGRPDFTSTGLVHQPFGDPVPPSPSASTMYGPTGLVFITKNQNKHYLYVADSGNNRVLAYEATTITNGEDAIGVLGQTDFTSNSCLTTQYGMCGPQGLSYNTSPNRLYVVDTNNHRILTFSFVHITTASLPNAMVDSSYYQALSTENAQGTVSYSLNSGSLPTGMSLGSVEGTPTQPGTYSFTVEARDSVNGIGYFTDFASYTLTVVAASGSALPPVAYAPPSPPTISGTFTITINNNDKETSNREVTLSLDGGPDAKTMALSQDPTFTNTAQQAYSTTTPFTLSEGNGTKTVYAKFYTQYGQPSDPVSDSIVLTGQGIEQTTKTTTSTTTPATPQAQLQSLLTQLATLQAQLAEMKGTSPITFTQYMHLGSKGEQVKELQQFLNSHGFVLAESGPGSAGNETDYFGQLTLKAVQAFQLHYKIVSSTDDPGYGYVGPKTRAQLNQLRAD